MSSRSAAVAILAIAGMPGFGVDTPANRDRGGQQPPLPPRDSHRRFGRPLAILVAAVLAALAVPVTPSVADEPGSDQTIIVTLDAGEPATAEAAQSAVEATGATVTDARPISERSVAVTVAEVSETKAQSIGDAAAAQSGVTAAQPSRRVRAATNDTYFPDLWNLNTADDSTYGVHAEAAWPTSNGAGVVVGVVDTGVTKHSDLSSATSIVGGNVIAGYDFITDPDNAGDGDGADDYPGDIGGDWHGTQVAGVIAALGHNAKGVVGVAPKASIQPLRVLGRDGGTEEDIIAAISWGAGLKVSGRPINPRPASVLNLSLASDPTDANDPSTYACDAATQTVINAAVAKGVVIVVAAGNDGGDLRYAYPANCQKVVRVTATNQDGTLADYSNYGSAGFPATVAAPGTKILSTGNAAGSEAYVPMTGTSMSAPHVSGILALMRAANRTLTNTHRLALLAGSAKPIAGCAPIKCGAGIPDAHKAVAAAKAAAPDITLGRPAWTGATKVGVRLTASAPVSPAATAPSWRWLRDGVEIWGANSATYTPTDTDLGHALSVRVTGWYDGATSTATSSAVTVSGLRFTSLAKPKVDGTYRVGHTLKVKAGKAKPAATGKRYQWLRDGKAIAKATRSRYRLVRADRHKKVSVMVTIRKPGYVSRSVVSAARKVR